MFCVLEVSAEEGKFGVNLVQEAVLVPAWVGGGWGVWWVGCLVGGVFGGRVFGGRFLVDVYGWLVGVWWVGGGW